MDDFATDKMRGEAQREGWVEKPIERPRVIADLPPEEQARLLSAVVEGCICRNQINILRKIAQYRLEETYSITRLDNFLRTSFGIESVEQVPLEKFDEVRATVATIRKR